MPPIVSVSVAGSRTVHEVRCSVGHMAGSSRLLARHTDSECRGRRVRVPRAQRPLIHILEYISMPTTRVIRLIVTVRFG